MIAVILGAVIAALCVVVVVMNLRELRQRPTRVARHKLDHQLAELELEVHALRHLADDFMTEHEDIVRQQYVRDKLALPIEELDAPGIGESTYKALRAGGIRCIADVPKLATPGVKVDNVGAKKTQQLLAAFQQLQRQRREEAGRMDRAALDAYCGGRLTELAERNAAEELERRRQLESVQLRLADLQRRRAQFLARS